jgi:hypothetical protein
VTPARPETPILIAWRRIPIRLPVLVQKLQSQCRGHSNTLPKRRRPPCSFQS